MADQLKTSETTSSSVDGSSLLVSLRVRPFRHLYFGGFAFGFSRWGLGFLATYVANELTESPRVVQLTGAAMWLPMLLAGPVAGALADRVDRKKLLLATIGVLIPVVATIGVLRITDRLQAWMLLPAMVVVGVSWVVDITARRTLALDLVGEELIDNAMALEAFSTAIGLATGVLAGGAVIAEIGAGAAFVGMAGVLGVAALSFLRLPAVPSMASRANPAAGSTARPLAPSPADGGFREVLASRRLRSVLGITMLANFFYFSHTPLVPVFAEQLDAGPFGAGLLASAGGFGMMISAVAVASIRPRRGPTYVAGVAIALLAVIGLARFGVYRLAFASSLVAATGFGLFSATQAVVTMTSVDPELKGRAMGLLSMAIGALPIGMTVLGEVAERNGPSVAVTWFAIVGLVGLCAWLLRRPEVLSAGRM